jgi:hypothetical protein
VRYCKISTPAPPKGPEEHKKKRTVARRSEEAGSRDAGHRYRSECATKTLKCLTHTHILVHVPHSRESIHPPFPEMVHGANRATHPVEPSFRCRHQVGLSLSIAVQSNFLVLRNDYSPRDSGACWEEPRECMLVGMKPDPIRRPRRNLT